MRPLAMLKDLWRHWFPRVFGDGTETRAQRVIRRVRVGIIVGACLVTLQSVLLVLGAWEIERRIEDEAINDQAARDQEDAINLSSQSLS